MFRKRWTFKVDGSFGLFRSPDGEARGPFCRSKNEAILAMRQKINGGLIPREESESLFRQISRSKLPEEIQL